MLVWNSALRLVLEKPAIRLAKPGGNLFIYWSDYDVRVAPVDVYFRIKMWTL